jgi:DNA repair protein RadB
MRYVSTGCEALDDMLLGGFPVGAVSLVYGEAETGKTTLALQCSVLCAKSGAKVVYVDADQSLSKERLLQISGHNVDFLARIAIFTPKNFGDQMQLVEDLPHYLSPRVALVVMDTVTSLYRLEVESAKKTFELNRQLNRQLAYLSKVAKENEVAILLLSQVHSAILKGGKLEPVANRLLRFWSDNILRLETTPAMGVKRAILEVSVKKRVYRSCFFKLTETGLSDST